MKRFAKFLIPLLLLAFAFGYTYYEDSFKIIGPPEFEAYFEEALALLEEKAPEYYDMVNRYIISIELVQEGDTHINYTGEIFFNMKDYQTMIKDEKCRKYYLASLLVHEGTHAKRLKTNKDTGNTGVEETIALKEEMNLAKLTNAPIRFNIYLQEKLESKWWEQQGK